LTTKPKNASNNQICNKAFQNDYINFLETVMRLRTGLFSGKNILVGALLSAATASALATPPGRMTGGGSIYCQDPYYRVTFGYQLHCQPGGPGSIPEPNNLEINFSRGDNFHLTQLNEAYCIGDGTTRPSAPFRTITGTGTGTFNGEPATVEYRLEDNAEPGGGQDLATFIITTSQGKALACTQFLEGGNNQAHRATGRIAR
jgi:hypothetical protein